MQKHSFLVSMDQFNSRHKLFSYGDSIIVAVSGGIDSMTLLDVLCEIQTEWKLQLAIAHFNHKLRAQESEEDEQFVREKAQHYSIPLFSHFADTKAYAEKTGRSLQDVARELRYQFFNDLRKSKGFKKIATAHNANDNAETILFNLLRGTGVKGLGGIPVRREDVGIIRPFLFATREEIQEYAFEKSVTFREDSSNKKTEYTRNFIRHTIFPSLRESINPHVTETLNRTGELFSMLENHLEKELQKISTLVIRKQNHSKIVLDLQQFLSLDEFLRYYSLFEITKQFTHRETDLSLIKEMLSIIGCETGSSCTVAPDVVFYKDRDRLILTKHLQDETFSIKVVTNQEYQFHQFRFSSTYVSNPIFSENRNLEFVDAERLAGNCVLRNWHQGDWFIPLGMSAKKKVSDFFIEQKVPLFEKSSIPILESNGEIVWICGYRLDNRFKVQPSTQKILKLEFEPKP